MLHSQIYVEASKNIKLQLIVGFNGIDAHQCNFMRFGAIRPKWQASNEIGVKSFRLYHGHP